MKLRAKVLAFLILCSLPAGIFAAGGADKGWGLLFDAKNLLAISGFEDGYQAGAGVKYWALPSIAARALVSVDYSAAPDSGPVSSAIGLGLAGEWHPSRGDVSPYLGPLAGMRALSQTGQDSRVDFYFGAVFGAEAKLLSSLSFFAEYDLIASFDAGGFALRLGTDASGAGKALIGFIVYF